MSKMKKVVATNLSDDQSQWFFHILFASVETSANVLKGK